MPLGPVLVTSAYGWLIRKGLPQRQLCRSTACADGIDLAWGADSVMCDGRLTNRRSQGRRARRAVEEVTAELERQALP
ncbi:hypothetical protein ACFWNL_27345 [Kitasatospora sp. NPDC058397]|uniref:hypothetical protein n=1 Tax=unclassified Kitasatospora TaxID=2633591 RepID=UPI003649D373